MEFNPEEALLRLRIPVARVKDSGVELGRGSYGKVRGVEFDGKVCASKEVHQWMLELPSPEDLMRVKNDFLRECHIWSMLRHPNVVQFLGIYYPSGDESGPPVMLMERMQESLRSLVEKHDNIPLLVKVSILHDASLGLRYLHCQDTPIVHRDLSPNNILVSPYLEAKITDLGVAKTMKMGNSKTMTATPGTAVFMPPEALGDRSVYGPSLDVFSFGGVMLHIATHQWPNPTSWSQIDPDTRKPIHLTEVQRRQQYIDVMTGGNAELKPLIISCLADDPDSRPTAADASEKIKELKELYTTHDMMDSLSWLAEIRRTSQPKQPQEQLVLNGTDVPDLINQSAKITWEEGAPAPILSGKFVAQAVSLNGTVYVGSGGCKEDPHFRIDAFHPDTNMWGDTIKTPVTAFALTALMDKLVVVGGETKNKKASNKVLILENHKLRNHSEMLEKRCDATAASYQWTMIIVGGACGSTILKSTEMYDSNTCQWYKCDDIPQPVYSLQSVVVDDVLYVMGGIKEDHHLSRLVYSSHLDNLSSHQLQWKSVSDIPRGGTVAVGLFNKYVLVLGGKSRQDTIHVLKVEKGASGANTSWHLMGTLPSVHYWATAVGMDNKIVIVGGRGDDATMTTAVTIGTVQ